MLCYLTNTVKLPNTSKYSLNQQNVLKCNHNEIMYTVLPGNAMHHNDNRKLFKTA